MAQGSISKLNVVGCGDGCTDMLILKSCSISLHIFIIIIIHNDYPLGCTVHRAPDLTSYYPNK